MCIITSLQKSWDMRGCQNWARGVLLGTFKQMDNSFWIHNLMLYEFFRPTTLYEITSQAAQRDPQR